MADGAALAHKDLRAALALGESLDVELPLARMTDDRCDAVFGLDRSTGPGRTVTTSFGEERMLIDGALVRASTETVFDTVDPATEEVLGVAADASDEDAERALAAARRAFDTTTWSTDVALRVRCLRQLQAAMRTHAEELRAMTIAETGSPLFMTRSAQLDDPVESLGWVADLAESMSG